MRLRSHWNLPAKKRTVQIRSVFAVINTLSSLSHGQITVWAVVAYYQLITSEYARTHLQQLLTQRPLKWLIIAIYINYRWIQIFGQRASHIAEKKLCTLLQDTILLRPLPKLQGERYRVNTNVYLGKRKPKKITIEKLTHDSTKANKTTMNSLSIPLSLFPPNSDSLWQLSFHELIEIPTNCSNYLLNK